MLELAPSLLSANFYNLKEELDVLEKNGIKYIHLDVMDGQFVPNISFGAPVIKKLRKNTNFIFDCHLMVQNPERFIKDFVEAGADIITIHIEATNHIQRVLKLIKYYGVKAGISLNPHTSLKDLEYIMDDLDLILIMSVNPGFGGQSFIPQIKNKIRDAKKMIIESKRDIILEVDGGIKTSNVSEIIELGANLIVSGSDVFCENIEEKLFIYKEIFKKYEK